MYHQDPAVHRLILASASPRRRELLTRAGYTFEVLPADIEERRLAGESARDFVTRMAVTKAETVAARVTDGDVPPVVLGADTVVVVDGDVGGDPDADRCEVVERVLGKPRDASEARMMLRRLSGRTHEVLTGVALVSGDQRLTADARTKVTFVTLDEPLIDWYVATREPEDKAGAYGVQGIGSRFVERIDGSYTNVVGLPVALVDRLLGAIDRN